MLPNGLNRPFNAILCRKMFSLCLSPLICWKAAEGAAIATLLTGTFITTAMAVSVQEEQIQQNPDNQGPLA
jgi:hypothetical protein